MKNSMRMKSLWHVSILVLGLLSGCGGGNGKDGINGVNGTNGTNGSNGLNGFNSLVAVTSEPPGANCSSGGTKIQSGLDLNANGVLDAVEVQSTQYVCNAAQASPQTALGLGILVRMDNEAPGANCTFGGKKISVGIDTNKDGLLSDSEISSSGYVCNGATGAAGNTGATGSTGSSGANGLNTLMRIVSEPAGVNCPYGGSKITSGLDANGNGVLDASEVTSTGYACSGAPSSAVTWVDVTGSAVQAQPNQGYLADNPTSPVAITLPTSPNLGDTVRVNGVGAGGWRILQNSGQRINLGALYPAGQSWALRNSGAPFVAIAMAQDGVRQVAASNSGGLYLSADAGVTWAAASAPSAAWTGVASSADGSKLVAVVNGGQIYTSSDSGATWTATESSRSWRGVASSADGTRLVAVASSGLIYTSADAGATWTGRDAARGWSGVTSSADGVHLAAWVGGGNIYTSSDSGATWTSRALIRAWQNVASSADGSRLAAVANNSNVIWQSSDFGVTWHGYPTQQSGLYAVAMSADGRKLFAASQSGAPTLYLSTDYGANWTASAQAPVNGFNALACSADGGLVTGVRTAVVYDLINNYSVPGQIYTSHAYTQSGSGSLWGNQFDAVELQYLGAGQFDVLSAVGTGLSVQ